METLSTTVLLIGYFITITGFLAGIIKLWKKNQGHRRRAAMPAQERHHVDLL